MEAAQTSFENLLLMKTPATIMIIFQLGDAYVAIAVLKKTCSSGPRPTQLLFYSFSPQNPCRVGFRVSGFRVLDLGFQAGSNESAQAVAFTSASRSFEAANGPGAVGLWGWPEHLACLY